MNVQGHNTPSAPSAPSQPSKPHDRPSAHHPTHNRGGRAPTPRPSAPKATPRPKAHNRPSKPAGKTAGRYEVTLDSTALVLIGMKQDGHIH